MPILKNPTLNIQLVSGTSKEKVTATVDVVFTSAEIASMQSSQVKYKLSCQIIGKDEGEDSGLNGSNDHLFWIKPNQLINSTGQYTFFTDKVEKTDLLDEDDQFQDEIIARFRCAPKFPELSPASPKDSPKVSGSF